MKRKLYFLAILMCILGGFNLSNLNAQTTVTIGNGTESAYAIADNYDGYGASQQIYTAAEIGQQAGTITSIAFHKAGGNNYNRTWSVYLKNIDEESFSGTTTYAMASENLVYEGTFNASDGWVVLDITDFQYTGNNLLVTVVDNSGKALYGGDQNWYYTQIYNDSKCLTKYNTSYIDITAPSGFSSFAGRFNIQLTFEGGTPQPQTQVIEIGSEEVKTNYDFPTNIYYKYSLTQQIYTSAEIGINKDLSIKSIAFKNISETSATRNIEIYMCNTTSSNCTYTSVAMNSNELVYSGNVNFVASDWTTITFQTPFKYEKGKNVLLCVVDKTGSWVSGVNFAVYISSGDSYYYRSDSYQQYAVNSNNGSIVSYRNYIKLECEERVTPLSLSVSADKECIPTDGSVQLTAAAQNGTGNYNYSWSPATGLSNTTSATTTFTPSAAGTYTFTCTVDDGETTATDDVTITVYEKPNLAKQYRIKVSTDSHAKYGQYFHINSTATPGDNTNVIANTYTESNNQIFTLEDAGNGNYYLRSADGYYIKCGTGSLGKAWNVYAYSTTVKTPIFFDYVDGSNFYLRDSDKSGNNYFKVEGANVYCDADINGYNANSGIKQTVTWTLEEAVVAEPEKPSAPTNLTANASSYNTIDLSWNAAAGATSYNIYLNGSNSKIGSVNGTSFQVTGLVGEKEYCFTVTAVNSVGESDPSEEECATTPAEPVGCKVIFELTAASDYGWGDNGGLAVYYTGGPVDGDILTLTNSTNKTYSYIWTEGTELSVILLTSAYPEEMGFTIKYENGVIISKYNIGEISSSLNNNMFLYRHIINCSTLPVPTVDAVAVGKSAIKLSWDELGGASGYNVYDEDGNLLIGNYPLTTYTVSDLDATTEYCFTVTAIFNEEESEHSNLACATTSDSDTNSGTIGNGEYTTSYIPIETYNKYSYSQQTYTKGDIEAIGGSEGYITSIAYNVGNVYTAINTRNIRVFMTNTANEITFTDGNELTYPVQNSDLVFEGPVTFTPGWVEIKFDIPFTYNGNHILVTVIDDTGETDTGDIYCYAHSKYTNTQYWSIRGNSADNKIDLTTSLSGKGFQSRNNIKLIFTSPYADLVFDGEGDWNNTANWNLRRLPYGNEDITITGDAVLTDDKTVESITIDGGSLTIGNGGILTVGGDITHNSAEAFVLKDGGQLFQNNADLQGTFVMDINNPTAWSSNNKTGWQFIASPFTDAAVSQFTNAGDEYDLYKFDGRHENLTEEWRNHKADANFEDEFVSGRGYMASYQNNTTATLSGTFNNATSISYPVTYQDINEGETHWPNFHLLGNPFTFNMDVTKLSMKNMATGVAVVNDEGGWDYLTSGSINVGDGFFVKSTAASPSVSYGVATRGGSDYNTSDNISVRVSSSASRDNVVLNFAGSDKAGFPKLNAMNEDIAYLYVVDNNERYGIFNYDKDVKEVPLSFEAQKMGNYTISVDAEGEYETIVLVDRQTGVETNMLLEDYKFTATTSKKENTDRFLVRFTFKSDEVTETERFAYQSGNELIIEDEGTVQLFDVTGRMLYISDVKSRGERINVGQLNKAAYILRLVNGEGVKVQKVIIY